MSMLSTQASKPPPPPTNSKLLEFVEDRIGYRRWVRTFLERPVHGGAQKRHALGTALAVLFMIQCLSGIFLATFYSPSVTDAWASVAYIEITVVGGDMLRRIHRFNTSMMVFLALLHGIHVVIRGAYKVPREVNWWTGLALFGLILTFSTTGYTLVWDQAGYWASMVRTGIVGAIPVIGQTLRILAIGGNELGNLTLTRTYTLHVVVLPGCFLAFLIFHIYLFRRKGYTASAYQNRPRLEIYATRQMAYDILVSAGALFVVAGLAIMKAGAPLGAPADPASNYIARPEWYFLPLFQSLKYFEGMFQILGMVFCVGLLVTFLVLLPLLDRHPSRKLHLRWFWMISCTIILASLIYLGVGAAVDDARDLYFQDHMQFSEREAQRALYLSRRVGVPAEGPVVMMNQDSLSLGERLFRRRCRSCHALEGFEPDDPRGPDLTGYGSKAWLRQLLRYPNGPRFFGRVETLDGMPSFAKLSESELSQLTNMLFTLKSHNGIGVEQLNINSELLLKTECADCHDFESDYAIEGPSLARFQSDAWIRAMIDDAGAKHLYGEKNIMPAFENKLSEFERNALVVFLKSLPSRADLKAWPHIDDPIQINSIVLTSSTSKQVPQTAVELSTHTP